MKYFIFIIIISTSVDFFGQEKKRSVQQMKSVSVQRDNQKGETLHVEKEVADASSDIKVVNEGLTVAYYENYIQALKTKISYIKSNEEENKLAVSNGWYEKMYVNIKRAEQKKLRLENIKK